MHLNNSNLEVFNYKFILTFLLYFIITLCQCECAWVYEHMIQHVWKLQDSPQYSVVFFPVWFLGIIYCFFNTVCLTMYVSDSLGSMCPRNMVLYSSAVADRSQNVRRYPVLAMEKRFTVYWHQWSMQEPHLPEVISFRVGALIVQGYSSCNSRLILMFGIRRKTH